MGFIAMKPMSGGMITNARISFKYLFQFPDVVPIPGIQRVWEIEEIVKILEEPKVITEAEREEMLQLKQKLGTKFCHRCDYCQPCQQGIPIAIVMGYPGLTVTEPQEALFEGFFTEGFEKAANCTQCGECEERCPYDLPIRETIAKHSEAYQRDKKKYRRQAASK